MYIAETNSTNDYLRLHPDISVIRTDYQTAGRGQLTNTWESERGKNLLFSVRFTPTQPLRGECAFEINRAVSVALYETVKELLPITTNNLIAVKWPNDLYWQHSKLAGILIENTLSGGCITQSIIGIGLNLNQTEWHSDAPNPCSLKQITGADYDAEQVMQSFLARMKQQGPVTTEQYIDRLYRRTGFHWWEERKVDISPTMNGTRTPQSFEARIDTITPQGELVLRTKDDNTHTYHFKEIKYIL